MGKYLGHYRQKLLFLNMSYKIWNLLENVTLKFKINFKFNLEIWAHLIVYTYMYMNDVNFLL